ncbi:hypothetical protein AKJ40_01835 [candidate division MSBL1 archaeon SCGC-AAA259M10]|uniref:Mth938-like domain-containing protein n=7 Tax=candidate division MSBL1 TaxID=215777 RepID=A0A133UZ04_9EURY|nr:hypothetical protein AKJ57_06550 [candidate division MSBL1 archaeon SCGC-AAA259A05]KXA89099.1 hypothetical protein AKJ62_03805 [candidate division MSBL1 archaeon SCGC-AAA259D14]KXA89270.1 hypothetical protein AKJ61_03235 [candidate division MSBL1 archaeon SCGC-AAA259B11]KXA91485.1 hypothetical protein AKJ63_01400 [candidate division MSBL1 archaeon SCGC-AAA259D18]KXA96798.1 hypothetical protein AKJ38_02575 [candidate division MSBL1 archaeon SCGC-AAA259I14]KXA99397.1 hypothetical protein AKJ4
MEIESYNFGEIVIDGKKYTNDVIVYPDRVEGDWWRKEGHSLHPEDIGGVLDFQPEVLIVGTGAYGRMDVPSGTAERIESNGIELIVKGTEEACETYNMIKGSKEAVAALHLTC